MQDARCPSRNLVRAGRAVKAKVKMKGRPNNFESTLGRGNLGQDAGGCSNGA